MKKNYELLRNDMINYQIVARGITDKKVIQAMKKVPREEFIDDDAKDEAYEDRPLPVGFGQTISQPYIVALMTESLELEGNEKVLEVGTGSGYQAAILAEIVKNVYTIEIVKSLFEKTKILLARYKNIKIEHRDGYYGWKEYAPFDRIIVTAAAEKIPPPLIEQLKEGGIMVIPSGPRYWNQQLLKLRKINGKIHTENIGDVAFVPFTRNEEK
ncbi:MAG: protein-L-isoaspartate(D-aspartate) O-methyltransferase [Actinobacteria bacterium]|nr:protein-L-isoaspartate(D-aspartate) O-methyltransferase [Actinomycetota bacterium]